MGIDPLDAAAVAIFAGIGISLLWNELAGISPGGPLAPSFLALVALRSPVALALVPLAAVVAGLATERLSHRVYVFGRRRYALLLLFGMAVALAVDMAFGVLRGPPYLRLLGCVAPGMAAYDVQRQGYARTLLPFLATAAAVGALVLALTM